VLFVLAVGYAAAIVGPVHSDVWVNGAFGIALGLGMGQLLKAALGLESAVPLWSIGVACGVSIGIGLIFGLLPANRAARMDPVEALRHE
jgi:putative ABC transport system permease protein